MARTPVWKTIAATLETDIVSGHYKTGDKLPTEAELASRFGVNRHTVRRPLSDMAERDIVRSRRRGRLRRAIAAAGRLPGRQVVRTETRPSDTLEAEALDIEVGSLVLVYEGLSLAGESPIGLFTSIFPNERLPGMSAALEQTNSVTEALKICGIEDYTRRETRLTAELATSVQAIHLRIREGDPLMKSVSVNIDANGAPVEFGTTWFAGERVALTIAPE